MRFLLNYSRLLHYPFLLFMLLFSFVAKAETSKCEQFVVAGAEQWVPFAYHKHQEGQLQAKGIAHDVIELIADDMGLKVKQKVGMPWKRIEYELEQGSLDILAGHYWSKARADKWLLTRAIAHEPVKLLTLKSTTFAFDKLMDLSGRIGVVPRGISLGQDFDQARKALRILEVRTHEQMYEMLNRGRVDYMVSPEFAALQHLRKAHNQNITFLDKAINLYPVHLSFSRHSACRELFPEFDRILGQKLTDGSIEVILSRYRKKQGIL